MTHEQAAAFALDALDPQESASFERHLAGCVACREAVEPFRTTAAALAFAGELPLPPPGLRVRVVGLDDEKVVPLRRRWARPAALAAAVAAVAAGVAVAALPTSPPTLAHVRAYPLEGRAPGLHVGGNLLVSDSRAAVLLVRGLTEAAPGSAYELWIVRGGRAVPAGFLRGGMGALARRVPPGASVAVSLEPARGSRSPSGPLLVTVETA